MIAPSVRHSSARRIVNLTLVLVMVAGLLALSPVTRAQAQTNILTLAVVSGRTEPLVPVSMGDPVGDYEYIINIDDTGTTWARSRAPGSGCHPDDAGYPDSCEWVSIAGVPSGSSPIFTQGDQDDFAGGGLNLPDGDYLISVLADGYKLGGKHFTVPLADPGLVTVELQPSPLPAATIQAAVFEDISPVNGAPDLPAEHGLAGFEATSQTTAVKSPPTSSATRSAPNTTATATTSRAPAASCAASATSSKPASTSEPYPRWAATPWSGPARQ